MYETTKNQDHLTQATGHGRLVITGSLFSQDAKDILSGEAGIPPGFV